MTRPSFESIYLRMATLLAQRSTCKRLQVGAVITSDDHRYVYGLGYNGGAAGLEDTCSGAEGACGCLHAEANAITNCTAPRHVPKKVYLTNSPCMMCAKMLINLGSVDRVGFLRQYRISKEVFVVLGMAGIEVYQA